MFLFFPNSFLSFSPINAKSAWKFITSRLTFALGFVLK